MASSQDATVLLRSTATGDPTAPAALLPLVYEELRGLAAAYLAGERPDHTLQATALVHEAYLRLVDQTRADWKDRAHFRAVAATVMRRILIDHARSRGRQKRQAGGQRLSFEAALAISAEPNEDLLTIDEALTRLAERDARKARVVELRFFGGLGVDETATVLGVSDRTVKNDWSFAKAWLLREITRVPPA